MAGSETRLPSPLTAFVGRKWELAELTEVVDRHRLVTLTGAGGCGKTRLAVELARRLDETRGLTVRFADLSPLDQGEFVLELVGGSRVPGPGPRQSCSNLCSRSWRRPPSEHRHHHRRSSLR